MQFAEARARSPRTARSPSSTSFGETKIPAPPKRVVSAGFTEQDDLLAVGVVPIAVTDWFGGEPFGVWPWAQPKLGAAQPRGAQPRRRHPGGADRVAEARSDRRHQRRPRPGHLHQAVGHRADDRAVRARTHSSSRGRTRRTAIGQAVFKADDMAALIAGVDDEVRRRRQEQPAVRRQEGAAARQGTFYQDSVRVTTLGWRAPTSSPTWASPSPTPTATLVSARQDGLRARRRRRADLDHRERRGTGRAACRSDRREAEGDRPRTATSSPARIWPVPSRSPRRCPTRWCADQLPPLLAKALA